jgi:hypothetical protein
MSVIGASTEYLPNSWCEILSLHQLYHNVSVPISCYMTATETSAVSPVADVKTFYTSAVPYCKDANCTELFYAQQWFASSVQSCSSVVNSCWSQQLPVLRSDETVLSGPLLASAAVLFSRRRPVGVGCTNWFSLVYTPLPRPYPSFNFLHVHRNPDLNCPDETTIVSR